VKGAPPAPPAKVLYEEDDRFGRARLEVDPEGNHVLTVWDPGRGAPGTAILLDGEELFLYRTWGPRFAEVLSRRVRSNPAAYEARNLLPPVDPWRREEGGEDRREVSPPRSRVVASLAGALALLALLFLLAWTLDPPSGAGAEREGTARALVTLGGDEGERHLLRVELPGGEAVLVPVAGSTALREGAPVTVLERRSRLFGKRVFLFVRYR
jgi:hypothetical protein